MCFECHQIFGTTLRFFFLSSPGIVAALTWPASLLAAASVIDHPWCVCLNRSAEVGKHLAQVLRSRQQVCQLLVPHLKHTNTAVSPKTFSSAFSVFCFLKRESFFFVFEGETAGQPHRFQSGGQSHLLLSAGAR